MALSTIPSAQIDTTVQTAISIQQPPPGFIAFFAGSTPPTGWIKANGALISRTAYSALFAAIGTTYGAGDGSTTFAVPDLRGEFIRAWDDARNVDVGRAIGSLQTSQNLSHTHGHDGYFVSSYLVGDGDVDGSRYATGYDKVTIAGSITASGGAEARPRNVAVMIVIKY